MEKYSSDKMRDGIDLPKTGPVRYNRDVAVYIRTLNRTNTESLCWLLV